MKKLLALVSLLLFIGCGENKHSFSETGPAGPQGEQGIKGDKGDKGNNGAKGETGLRGLKGEKGDTGAMGPKGEKGHTGKSGEKGHKGDTGPKGERGPKGENGLDGKVGPKGDKGDKGDTGVLLKIHELPKRGACVSLGDGLYAENEGDHADIYANDRCNHTTNNGVICNNMHDGEGKYATGNELCWVGCRQFSIEGQYDNIKLYEMNFKCNRESK